MISTIKYTENKEARTANTGFASGGVMCKLGVLSFYSGSVLAYSFVLRNPPERKARNRCGAIRRHIGSPDCMRRCGLERLTSAHLRDFSAARSFATPAPKPRKSGDPLLAI
jgi:hypothetical protein